MKGFKKVEKLEVGMEVWMKFRVESYFSHIPGFPFRIPLLGTFTQDCRQLLEQSPLEMFTIDENEIPELKGVEMEVSHDEHLWQRVRIYFKSEDGYFYGRHNNWKHARPIQKTLDLTNVPENLITDELKKYLK